MIQRSDIKQSFGHLVMGKIACFLSSIKHNWNHNAIWKLGPNYDHFELTNPVNWTDKFSIVLDKCIQGVS